MSYNVFAFIVLSVLAVAIAVAASRGPKARLGGRLLVVAVGLRVVGSLTRYLVLHFYYDGAGDATGYYQEGLAIAASFRRFDLSELWAVDWVGGSTSRVGTLALQHISGLVLTVIGPTMLGEFLVFSLLSFLGLWFLALAVRRTTSQQSSIRFAAWIWLWPSLWFWPSSVGKEAIIILAIGLTTLGYVGRNDRIQWGLFLAGISLAFLIRPHVAAVLVLAAGAAHWLGRWNRVTGRRIVEAVAALALAVVVFNGLLDRYGLADADLEGIQEYVQRRAFLTLRGGSQLEAIPSGLVALPMALVNIWMRPFPWDVHNAMSLISSLEVVLLWILVFRRRRGFRMVLRLWRRHRLLRFALPFLLLYTVMIGLTFANLGIIARQRAPLFPFFFMVFTAVPIAVRRRRRRLVATRHRQAARLRHQTQP